MASHFLIIGLLTALAFTVEAQSDALFDYGPTIGDTDWGINNKEVKIDIDFKFYGQEYNHIYAARDGHISFGQTSMNVAKKILPFAEDDAPIAAVYFASVDDEKVPEDPEDARSRVYYRKVEKTDTDYPAILKTLGHQVRINSVNDMSRFWPKRAVIVTWHNVRAEGCRADRCKRNTYQAAIFTDDVWTYAIYNYRELTWRGGLLEGCVDGVGADCFSAQVGFNAGGGREFTPLPHSGTDNVLSLVDFQGSKVKGRYIYQVSTRRIIRDGCTTADKTLTLYPRETGMLGGAEIHVAGFCLLEGTKSVTCQVGSSVPFPGTVLDTGRISCITPLHYGLGEVKLTVTYGNEKYSNHIQIAPARMSWSLVKLEDYGKNWIQRDPEVLSLSWSPARLNGLYIEPENTTADPPSEGEVLVDKVIVALFGYAEITAGGSSAPVWKLLTILHPDHENSGKFSFKPAEHRCTHTKENDCTWQIGAIKIVPADGDENGRGLFSDLFPMGWYIEDEMVKNYGEDWPQDLCEKWQDQADGEWQEDLLECPCTRSQAYTDKGHFILDPDCDGSGPCPFHPDASICFLSRIPTKMSAQTRCCYKATEGHAHESLIYSSGSPSGGSFSAAAHENGLYPYMLPKRDYPLFSHWVMDKLPMIWCCVWSSNDLCLTHYEPKRPTPGCNRGHISQSAFAFGDPHFKTFDGTAYTFNGYAEYWLLRVKTLTSENNFRLQARMENYIGSLPGELNATVITAVAIQQGDDLDNFPRVNLFLNPPLALDRMSVYVDGAFQEFFTVDLRGYLDDKKENMMYITRNSDPTRCNNFTITFSNGASVTVAEDAGMLQVQVTAPPSFYKNTEGLFGYWDGDRTNDLKTRDGKTDIDPNNHKQVHEKFGADWAVKKEESVFNYFRGHGWAEYQKMSFMPVFEPKIIPGSNLTETDVKEKCQNDKVCQYDYMVTLSAEVASASLAAQAWAEEMTAMSQKVDACPYLKVELSKRSADSNLAGEKVTLTSCVSGYTLVGPTEYTCAAKVGGGGVWVPAPSSTICKSDQAIAAEQQQTAVAIAVPITLVVLILFIAIAAFMVFRRKKANAPQKPKQLHDDLPRQQPPVNPNPGIYAYPEANLSLSQTSVSSHASRASNNSIILDQVIYPQRPPRPQKTLPRDAAPPGHHYANAPGVYDNETMVKDREMQPPQFRAPPPPSGGYENRGSDMMADSDEGFEPSPPDAGLDKQIPAPDEDVRNGNTFV